MTMDAVQKEYARLASIYDRRWSFYVQATIQRTIARLPIAPGDRILDVGCGTGTLLQQLLQVEPQVTCVGVDPSDAMLAIARQKLPPSVELQVGSADRLPFANHSFEQVISTSAFHYFRNPAQAVQEMKRVLKPGGNLVITDWCHDYFTCRLCHGFLRLFNRAHFRTYGLSECRAMLQQEELYLTAIERYKIDWLWGMMTAQAIKRSVVEHPDRGSRNASGAERSLPVQ